MQEQSNKRVRIFDIVLSNNPIDWEYPLWGMLGSPPTTWARNKKSDPKVAFFVCFKEFKGLEALYGAADGTRTRDPRRDRPVF